MLGSKWDRLSIPDKINHFLEYFTKMTKEDCDYIEHVLRWDDETKMSFLLAKKMFEEKD